MESTEADDGKNLPVPLNSALGTAAAKVKLVIVGWWLWGMERW